MTQTALSDSQWQQYQEQGYLLLEVFLDPQRLKALQRRIDDIMLGNADLDYDRTMMQLDSETGRTQDVGAHTVGHKGATLNYRKIQDLEFDPLFLETMRLPLIEDVCRRTYGAARVATFRAMFMNKPANRGTALAWHQDRWSFLDRDPQLTVWMALDPATRENGCLQIVPGSHRTGLINPDNESGFLTEDQVEHWVDPKRVHYLELGAGDAVLLHNKLLHASDVNRSGQSRRAFSACYMDADTVSQRDKEYPVIFGAHALRL